MAIRFKFKNKNKKLRLYKSFKISLKETSILLRINDFTIFWLDYLKWSKGMYTFHLELFNFHFYMEFI